MDSEIHVKKIIKLLRIARDQSTRPEGKTAARLAEVLQKRHGIKVELSDEDEELDKQSAMVASGEEPCAWKEWVAEGVSTAYRCKCAPMWLGRSWQLWIFCRDPHRLAACRAHFDRICRQIDERHDAMFRMRFRTRNRFEVSTTRSYMEGLALRAAKRLLEDLGWDGPVPFSEEGFDVEEFNSVARDPYRGLAMPPSDSTALMQFVHRVFDGEPEMELERPDDDTEPDPFWFARGYEEGRYLDLAPPRNTDDAAR